MKICAIWFCIHLCLSSDCPSLIEKCLEHKTTDVEPITRHFCYDIIYGVLYMYMIWKCCNYVINYYLSLWYNNLKLTQCTYLRVYDCKIEFDKNMHIYIYTFMVFFFLRKHGEFHIRQSCLMIVKSKFTKMKFTERK